MQKALIFGINGQDGYYLNRLLQQQQIEVVGVSRSTGNWLQGNVADHPFIEQLIREQQPDYIFHLAAHSSVQHGLLFEHQATIVNGAINIFESVYRHSPHSKIFITGSGLQFQNNGEPVSEKNDFCATSAYNLARIEAVFAARYFRTKNIRIYVGYLFHHDSPMRTRQHLNRQIVDAVKQIGSGKKAMLMIGDIKVEKEFGFAGDIVQGIFQLIKQDVLFEACIGTGKAYSIEKWLEICFSSIHKKWQDYVQLKNDYVPEFRRLLSDPSAIRKIKWESQTGIEELAKMMLTA